MQCTFSSDHRATWQCSCCEPALHLCGSCLSFHLAEQGQHLVSTLSPQEILPRLFLERRERLRRRLTHALDSVQELEEVSFQALDLAPSLPTADFKQLLEARTEAAQIGIALHNARTKVKYAASLLEASTNPCIKTVGADLRRGLETSRTPVEQGEQLGVAMNQLASALAGQTETREPMQSSSLLETLRTQLENVFSQALSVAEAADRPELRSQCYQAQLESDPEVRLPHQLHLLSIVLQEAETGLRFRTAALRKAKQALGEATALRNAEASQTSHRRTVSAESLGELLETVNAALGLEPVDLKLRQPAAPQPPEASSTLRQATEVLLQKLRVPLDQVQLTNKLTGLEKAEGTDHLAQEQALVLWEIQQACHFLDNGLLQDLPRGLPLNSICADLMETLELLSCTESAAVHKQSRQLAALQRIHAGVERLVKASPSSALSLKAGSSNWATVQEAVSQAAGSLVHFLDAHGPQELAKIGRECLSSPEGDVLTSVNEKLVFMKDALSYVGVNYLETIGQMLWPVFQVSMGNLRAARDLMSEGSERMQVDTVLTDLESKMGGGKREVKASLESAESAMQKALEGILPPDNSEEARQHSLYEALRAAALRSRIRVGVDQALMVSKHLASLLPTSTEQTSFLHDLERVSCLQEEEEPIEVLSHLLEQLALMAPLVKQGPTEEPNSHGMRLTQSTEANEEAGSVPLDSATSATLQAEQEELRSTVAGVEKEVETLAALLDAETKSQPQGLNGCLQELKRLSTLLQTQHGTLKEIFNSSVATLAEFGMTPPTPQQEQGEMILDSLSRLRYKARAVNAEEQQRGVAASIISRLKVTLDIIVGTEFSAAWKPVAHASPFEKLRVIATHVTQMEDKAKHLEMTRGKVKSLVPLLQQCKVPEVHAKLKTGDIVSAAAEGLALWIAERNTLARALDMSAGTSISELSKVLEAGLSALCETAGVHNSTQKLSEVRNKVEALKHRARSLKVQLKVMLRDVEQQVESSRSHRVAPQRTKDS